MNKVILMGRLTRDPETRYSQSASPVAITRYSIAVRRSFARQGEPDVDFFNIVAFGKAGEFAEKYFKKGQMVAVVGKLQNNTWQDGQGNKRTTVEVIAEEQHFAESKSSFENRGGSPTPVPSGATSPTPTGGYTPVDFDEDDDLPF